MVLPLSFVNIRQPDLFVSKQEKKLNAIITTNAALCSCRPCIRGLRIRVSDVLDLLASGLNNKEIIEEFPKLTEEDIRACLAYASRRIDHPTVRAA